MSYSSRTLTRAMLILQILTAVGTSDAETVPTRGLTDPRIRTAAYRDDEVYRLQGIVGYGIELIFEPGEEFVGQAGGDLDAITFGAHAHHVILKPRAAHVGTNFVVYTSRRAYRFDYTVVDRPSAKLADEAIYAVRFTYPPPTEANGPTQAEQVEANLTAAREARPRNVDYWFCGDPAIKPIAASDDGVHTRLTFSSHTELPAIFVRGADDTESLLNFSIDAGDIVIHRVARAFTVRRGALTGCIVNNGFSGAGERLESGTVAPTVQRARRGSRP
ncbi:TrbG/VirB9 family P-type conjugative transfer protein [Steroidobacter agaridevorans]|uniref:TrbG/VirB9 family P-type conjugative transfer protein n=1 Tax=Steroidobacter agaridevorans TaxID=2695856 RepID=UPI0013262B6D|nr:TrbG/VirB9 family P-type conjugative transfer protein [Steroidobacter agaridevorans]GFE87295.1 P-type conjugative transfer protein VirB9 [Steroidobacter agaridevorans]